MTRPRCYKTWVHSQTQNKAQWLAAWGHVSVSSQLVCLILSLRLYSSFITSRPGTATVTEHRPTHGTKKQRQRTLTWTCHQEHAQVQINSWWGLWDCSPVLTKFSLVSNLFYRGDRGSNFLFDGSQGKPSLQLKADNLWPASNGSPTLKAGCVALLFSRGLGPVLLSKFMSKPIALWFSRGDPDHTCPTLDPHMKNTLKVKCQ